MSLAHQSNYQGGVIIIVGNVLKWTLKSDFKMKIVPSFSEYMARIDLSKFKAIRIIFPNSPTLSPQNA